MTVEAEVVQADGRLYRTFRALRVPNFRRFFMAQTISVLGTWLQFMGQIWLVIEVLAPGNGTVLGVTAAFQSFPVIVTLWGGALADRYDKRVVLLITQSLSGLLALTDTLRLLAPLVTLSLVAIFALNFNVTLPLLSTDVLHSGLTSVTWLLTVSSISAVLASLFVAGWVAPKNAQLRMVALGL